LGLGVSSIADVQTFNDKELLRFFENYMSSQARRKDSPMVEAMQAFSGGE